MQKSQPVGQLADGELHGAAVKTPMLTDDRTTINANDFPVREGLADGTHGFCIKVWLIVGRHQHSSVDDKVVGIGSG